MGNTNENTDSTKPKEQNEKRSTPEENMLFANGQDSVLGQDVNRIFEALCHSEKDYISEAIFWENLLQMGIRKNDPRLKEVKNALRKKGGQPGNKSRERSIHRKDFYEIASQSNLLRKTLLGDLIISDFPSFTQSMTDIYEQTHAVEGGRVATYIPQLARVDPSLYAISVCTIDGQRFSIGDTQERFCLQSTCKPILYALAQENFGPEKVHQHVGMEPSGQGFNELSLDRKRLPHNPMINAGAIMCSALIRPELNIADRFDYIMNTLEDLSGGHKPSFNNAVYLSEKQTADRNFALAYFMRENGAFPPNTDILEVLDFYFQCCSIEVEADALANIGASLANSGICPFTDKRVFSSITVQNCVSLMYSCGMYDYSGEFAFKIGLPAKSGVSGALLVVVPDLMGICVWSPPLDALGNSVKGVAFCRQLVDRYNLHKFDVLAGEGSKRNVTSRRFEARFREVMALISSASLGDLSEIQKLVASGTDLNHGDYDQRTALHLAAAEGHLPVVKYLVEKGVDVNAQDRWGGTPLGDAQRHQQEEVMEYLKRNGAKT